MPHASARQSLPGRPQEDGSDQTNILCVFFVTRGEVVASNQALKECRIWSLVEHWPGHAVSDSTQCMGVAVNTNKGSILV